MDTDDVNDFEYLAHFIITHPTYDFANLVDLFVQRPVLQLKKGDELRSKLGVSLKRKAFFSIVSWRLHSEAIASSSIHPLGKVLSDCLEALSSNKQRLPTILKTAGTMRIEIALRPSSGYCVWGMPPSLMRKLSSFGIQVDFCFIVPPGLLVAKH